jgi:hypothetical protein
MNPVPEDVFHDYLHVLERAILDLRARIRCEDDVAIREVHDMLHAVHNIPQMLRSCEGWHVPENIDADLARYDQEWLGIGNARLRKSLMGHLKKARAGDYDRL